MTRKILLSFDMDNPVEVKTLMEIISKHVGDMQGFQQKLSTDPKNNGVVVGGGESPVFVPVTLKQRALMDKYHIKYDEKTSMGDASDRITKYFNKLKNKGD